MDVVMRSDVPTPPQSMPQVSGPVDLVKFGSPERFDGDVGAWPQWSYVMKEFLIALGVTDAAELDRVENFPKPITLAMMDAAVKRRAATMKYVLTMKLGGTTLAIIQRVEAGNGFEAWRQLHHRYSGTAFGISGGLMQRIVQFQFGEGPCFLDDLAKWELLVKQYNECNPLEEVSESLKRSTLLRGAPKPIRAHLRIAGMAMDYASLRAAIEEYVRSDAEWQTEDTATSSTSAAPMDISAIDGGKSKGRQGKGKKGKRWLSGRGKGQAYEQEKPLTCQLCDQPGHSARDCVQYFGFDEEREDLRCWVCGGTGHKAKYCASRSSMTCELTDEPGQSSGKGHPPPGLTGSDKSQQKSTVQDQDVLWQMGLFPTEELAALTQQASEVPLPSDEDEF